MPPSGSANAKGKKKVTVKNVDQGEGSDMSREVTNSALYDSNGCLKIRSMYDLLPQGNLRKEHLKYMDLEVLFQKLKYGVKVNEQIYNILSKGELDSKKVDVMEIEFVWGDDEDQESHLNIYRVITLLMAVRQLLMKHKPCEQVPAPALVFTDTHGQFGDVLRWLAKVGGPEQQETYYYVVCGDTVDRGPHGLEVLLLFLYYKLRYPSRFFLLRGNHEDATLNERYGFLNECKRRFQTNARAGTPKVIHRTEEQRRLAENIFHMLVHVYRSLPVCAVLEQKVFCAHAGISPLLTGCRQCEGTHQKLMDVCEQKSHLDSNLQSSALMAFVNTRIRNPCEIGITYTSSDMERELRNKNPKDYSGLMMDILWSDPSSSGSTYMEPENDAWKTAIPKTWRLHKTRGTSFEFGTAAIEKFLRNYNMELIVRGHDMRIEGYEWHYLKRLLTVFSAPAYVGNPNKGGIALVTLLIDPGTQKRKLRVDPIVILSGTS